MSVRWNLYDWMQSLDNLCMTYWSRTVGEFEERELLLLWNTCMSPQDAFQVLAKRFGMTTELPEPSEYENAPESDYSTPGASVRTMRESTSTGTTIITDRPSLSQAVRNFKKAFPHHAENAARLKQARALVNQGAVFTTNGSSFQVTDDGRDFFIAHKRCNCEIAAKHVCVHRIAVCLAVSGNAIWSAKRLQAHEHAAVLNEEQDPGDDAHAQHGTWSGPVIHQCADGEVIALPPAELGTPIACPRCQQPYCAECDQEAHP